MAEATAPADEQLTELSPGAALRLRILGHKGLLAGFGIVCTMAVLALLAPLLSPHDPYEQILANRLLPPVWAEGGSWQYILGTDYLGRDYLSRLLYGARISLLIGLGAAAIGAVIGVTLGVCAGYFGGRVDQALMYLFTCQLALPGLLLILALVVFIGPSMHVLILLIGALGWTLYFTVTRSATMQIRQFDYITAARALGSSKVQILSYEVIPNLLNQIIVVFTLEVGFAIITEASLSFFGIGVQPPTPAWGLMINEGRSAMFFRPWLVLLPGFALFILVIGINLMGDGIRDVTAPENRN